MGHLYVICGPPGAGKTTLIKQLEEAKPQLKHVKRITTRGYRAEEGDTKKQSLEYYFLDKSVFSSQLADHDVINLIEWNGNYYATRRDKIEEVLKTNTARVLLEDIPSAVHLKAVFGSRVTVVLLFVADRDSLLEIEFAEPWSNGHPVFDEWMDRIRKKYSSSIGRQPVGLDDPGWLTYVEEKTRRAIPDLAFIAGRIRAGEEVHVLANLKDKKLRTYRKFEEIMNAPIARAFISHAAEDEEHALKLQKALKDIKVPSFLDKTDLGWGSMIVDEIKKELQQCSHLIVVISPSALKSQWVHFEIGQAVALGKAILPFLTDSNLHVPDYLRHYKPATTLEDVIDFFHRHSNLKGR